MERFSLAQVRNVSPTVRPKRVLLCIVRSRIARVAEDWAILKMADDGAHLLSLWWQWS